MTSLKCILCNSTFQNTDSGLMCPQCKRVVKQKDGVFSLAKSDDYYYNIIPKNDMNRYFGEGIATR